MVFRDFAMVVFEADRKCDVQKDPPAKAAPLHKKYPLKSNPQKSDPVQKVTPSKDGPRPKSCPLSRMDV